MSYQSCNDHIKEVNYTNLLFDSNIIDGLIFLPSKETLILKKDDHLMNYIERGLPVVFINKYESLNFASNVFNKKSDCNVLNKNGFEAGENSVKKLLAKIKNFVKP